MPKKILNSITHNLGYKLLSLLFAAVLWIFVVNYDDPKMTKSFTSSVSLENASYLTEMGKCYTVLDNSNVIQFTVSAKRSYMEKLASTDFKVSADFQNIIIDEEKGIGSVPIDISALRYSSQITIPVTHKELVVSLEDVTTSQFIVSAQTTGTLNEGKVLGEVKATPNLIRISGPKSIMDQVSSVYARIDVTGMTGDVSSACIPVLCDEYDNPIDTARLTYNTSTITVNAEILDTKDVGLVFAYTGEPDEGFILESIEYEPETVTVKGKVAALNRITNISVPAAALDITGARGDVKQTIDVSAFLPGGVSLVGDGKVNVTAVIDSIVSKNITFFTSRIEILNLPDDCDISFRDKYISLVLTGKENIINNTSSSSVVLTLDASLLSQGSNKARLLADVPVGVDVGEIFADVVLTKKDDNSGIEASDNTETDTGTEDSSAEQPSSTDTNESDDNEEDSESGPAVPAEEDNTDSSGEDEDTGSEVSQ